MNDQLVKLSHADNLVVSKSTLYKWSAKKTVHPQIFRRLGGRVYVNITELNKVVGGVVMDSNL